MSTLESQYKSYLKENPDSAFTYDEWFKWFGERLSRSIPKPAPDEKICYNCEHLAWAVGVGQGLLCIHPKAERPYPRVPSSRHTCEMFKLKTQNNV